MLFVFAGLIFLAAGTIKGTVGIGLPAASVGMLSQSLDPRTAIALVVFPMMVSNTWQVFRAGDTLRAFKDHWVFAVVLVLVLWPTTALTAAVSEAALLAILSGVIVGFALINLMFTPPRLADRYDKAAQIAGGIFGGVMGAFTGIWAPPVVVYLIARRAEKDEFVRVTGLLFLLGSLPLCIGFWQQGLLTGDLAVTSAAMIVPTLTGFALGEVIRRHLPADRFRTVVLLVFLVMGLNLLRRAFW